MLLSKVPLGGAGQAAKEGAQHPGGGDQAPGVGTRQDTYPWWDLTGSQAQVVLASSRWRKWLLFVQVEAEELRCCSRDPYFYWALLDEPREAMPGGCSGDQEPDRLWESPS